MASARNTSAVTKSTLNSSSSSVSNGMSRLEELWQWQSKKKTSAVNQQRDKGSKQPRKATAAQPASLPRYMQPTQSAKLRQADVCATRVPRATKVSAPTAKVSGANMRTRVTLRSTNRSTLTVPANIEKRNKLSVQKAAVEKGTLRSTGRPTATGVVKTNKQVNPSKVTKGEGRKKRKLTLNNLKHELPTNQSQKRNRTESPEVGSEDEGQRSKRRRQNENVPISFAMEEEMETDPAPPKAPQRKSFAPKDTEFTFSMAVTPSRLASFSRPTLESIEENSSAELDDHAVFDEAVPVSSFPNQPAPAAGTLTPADRLTSAASTPALGSQHTSRSRSLRKGTPNAKFENVHSLRQQLLSDKLRKASSPEEKLEILSQSPMIELSRKKSTAWRSSSPKPSLHLEVDAEDVVAAKTKKDVAYFRGLVLTNTDRLESMAQHWDVVREGLVNASEEVQGEIRTTSCQARLIVAERFKQFSGLITNCANKTGDKPVLAEDLEGFWDMIYFQVEDVMSKFANLEKLQAQNWTAASSPQTKVPAKAKLVKKKVVKTVKGSSKFSAFRAQMQKNKQESSDSETGPAGALVPAGSERTTAPADCGIQRGVRTPQRKSVRIVDPTSTDEMEIEEKTYSLRTNTVLQVLDSSARKHPVTPASNSKLKNVMLRSVSTKRSRRSSASRSMALSAKSPLVRAAQTETAADASPELPLHFSFTSASKSVTRRSVVRPLSRVSCSPSPLMVRAILSASKSGKKSMLNTPLLPCEERSSESDTCSLSPYLLPTRISDSPLASPYLHKGRRSVSQSLARQALTRNLSPANSPLAFSPASRLQKLNIDDEQGIVNDLVVFTPEPSVSSVTPRRSTRIASATRTKHTKRISLL